MNPLRIPNISADDSEWPAHDDDPCLKTGWQSIVAAKHSDIWRVFDSDVETCSPFKATHFSSCLQQQSSPSNWNVISIKCNVSIFETYHFVWTWWILCSFATFHCLASTILYTLISSNVPFEVLNGKFFSRYYNACDITKWYTTNAARLYSWSLSWTGTTKDIDLLMINWSIFLYFVENPLHITLPNNL
jgi:hypothetical protein